MIVSVKKLPNNEFLINDFVVMYNLSEDDGQIIFDVNWDEAVLTENEAIQLCEEFIKQAITEVVLWIRFLCYN